MTVERLNGTLQENILTLLAHSDEFGKIVVNVVNPALFEGDYRVLAERVIDYWKRHGEAPKYHTADLVGDILEDKHNRRAPTYRRILTAMIELSENINTGYVLAQLHTFTRMQRLKDAILKSADQLNAKQEHAIAEVEAIWNDLLRVQDNQFAAGSTLRDYEALVTYLQRQYNEFLTGIAELDRAQIVPARGTVLLFLAAAKRGKSWFLNTVGKQALMQRKNVCHISLEMDEMQVLQRYYQSLFAVSKGEGKFVARELQLDDRGRLVGIDEQRLHPDFTLTDKNAELELEQHIEMLGARADRLRIKRFPPRSISVDGIRAYLDNLEVTEHFIPDILILDYAGLLKTDANNHRITLGRAFEDLRGLGIERNMAVATAHQISKAGAEALFASSTHVAEDWSMIATADIILTYSSTDAEKRLGLGRLKVSQARDASDAWGVLLAQSYATGQFALASAMLDSKYFEMLDELKVQHDMVDDDVSSDDDAE